MGYALARGRAKAIAVAAVVSAALAGRVAPAAAQTVQTVMTWADVRAAFEASNPSLLAGRVSIDESRASEVTAGLRPNPEATFGVDQIGHTATGQPFAAMNTLASVSYLHERGAKREIRLESARSATAVAGAAQDDLERTLLFDLRNAFVAVLQAKAFRDLATASLQSFDQVLTVGRDRLQAGDIAQVDFDRLQLRRVQYESDLETSEVNLRTAKIDLIRLIGGSVAVDAFDVAGPFEYAPLSLSLDDLRREALDNRPDLKSANLTVEKARADSRLAVANGASDPTFSVNAGFPSLSFPGGLLSTSYNPALFQYVGLSVSMPLRLFDRNQGEKARTQLEVTRASNLSEATRRQVVADVDSAYATITSAAALLEPYRRTYLDEATRVRDTVTFAYQNGGASLVDFLEAQQDYRAIQVGYVNLVGSYLNALSQLSLAVGREILP